jgi:hypothetical protein
MEFIRLRKGCLRMICIVGVGKDKGLHLMCKCVVFHTPISYTRTLHFVFLCL